MQPYLKQDANQLCIDWQVENEAAQVFHERHVRVRTQCKVVPVLHAVVHESEGWRIADWEFDWHGVDWHIC